MVAKDLRIESGISLQLLGRGGAGGVGADVFRVRGGKLAEKLSYVKG